MSQHGAERTAIPMTDFVVPSVSRMVAVLDLLLLIATFVVRIPAETRAVFAFVRSTGLVMIVGSISENAILYVSDVTDKVLLLARCVCHTQAATEMEFASVMTTGKEQPAKAMLVTATHTAMDVLDLMILSVYSVWKMLT